MTPVLCPNTFITPKTARKLCRLFGPVTILQPSKMFIPESMEALVEKDLINLSYPEAVDEDLLSKQMTYFQQIGALQDPDTLRRLKLLKYESDHHLFPANIRAQILQLANNEENDEKGDEKKKTKEDPLLTASLFLSLAQMFDEQQAQIVDGFRMNQKAETRMLKDVRGQQDTEDNRQNELPQPSLVTDMDLMIKERLAAWKTLCRVMPPIQSPCFIATNRAVWDVISSGTQKSIWFDTIYPDLLTGPLALTIDQKLKNRIYGALNIALDMGFPDGIWIFSPHLIFG